MCAKNVLSLNKQDGRHGPSTLARPDLPHQAVEVSLFCKLTGASTGPVTRHSCEVNKGIIESIKKSKGNAHILPVNKPIVTSYSSGSVNRAVLEKR